MDQPDFRSPGFLRAHIARTMDFYHPRCIDPAGGFGKVGGLVLALVILQIISTACVVLGLSQFLTLTLWGAILIAVGGSGSIRRAISLLLENVRSRSR